MSIHDTIRNQARTDSRRFANGALCDIVHDPFILSVMYRYQIVPPGILLDKNGFDSRTGRLFVIPTIYSDEMEYYKRISIENQLTATKEVSLEQKTSTELLIRASQQENILADFLKQTLVFAMLPVDSLSGGKIPNPRTQQVVVETLDVGQTISCRLVYKGGSQFDSEESLNDD